MKILHMYTDKVTFENNQVKSIKELVELAAKQGANLEDADLIGANLRDADLKGANLEGANLEDADLIGANLRDAYLIGANLRDANLRDAYLIGANLRDAYLRGADLRGTYLRDADLRDANLIGANLEGADLRDANLEGAELRDANLEGADLPHFKIVPEIGSFMAYKKLKFDVIVQIEIPEYAKRTNSLRGHKCRTNEFKIIKIIENPDNVEFSKEKPLQSTHFKSAGYYVGGTFKEPDYNDDIRLECTKGLHFFMTLKEAQEWS